MILEANLFCYPKPPETSGSKMKSNMVKEPGLCIRGNKLYKLDNK